MHTTQELQNIVNSELEKLNFALEPKELYEPIEYTMSQEGKRLRPFLCLHACDLFDGNINDAIPAAMGIEVFHNFTLVHDDIMDNAPIRRGKPTVYKKWNTNIALLSGDTMFAKAFELVSKTPAEILPRVLEVFTTTSIEVCEGQQYDMNFETAENVSIQDYLMMIRLKTAVLIAASLKVGAIISRTNDENIQNLSKFGEAIGMTFQLQDDLLDAYADESKFGKQIGSDIITNKKTFLYLKALELANPKQKSELVNLYSSVNNLDNNEKISQVLHIYAQLDIQHHTRLLMKEYYDEAMKHLENVRIPDNRKDFLIQFSNKLMEREK